jgi:hypothetical protein
MEFYEPYREPHVNVIYNLLFCDEIADPLAGPVLARATQLVHRVVELSIN